MLQLFPEDRATVAECLVRPLVVICVLSSSHHLPIQAHPFFDLIRVPESEICSNHIIEVPEVTRGNVRDLILEEVDLYNGPGSVLSTPAVATTPALAPAPAPAPAPREKSDGRVGGVSWAPDVETPAGQREREGRSGGDASTDSAAYTPASTSTSPSTSTHPPPVPGDHHKKKDKCVVS